MPTPPQQLVMQIAKLFPDAIFYKETAEKVVALTIDDVPTPDDPDDQTTQDILDVIADFNQGIETWDDRVRATFFMISGHLCEGTTIIDRILQQGHEIGNHGTADETTALLHPEQFSRQLQLAHDCIGDRTGQPLQWYRPGRGLYNREMVQVLKTMPGYIPRFALASMIPFDTFKPTNDPLFTAWYISQFIFPGAILVIHGGSVERSQQTVKALKIVLYELKRKGFRAVTLSELWNLST